MNEGKRMLVSFLRVGGVILLGFPIYVYFVNPTGWFRILPFQVSSMAIGAILVVASTLIWNRERKKNSDINPEGSIL